MILKQVQDDKNIGLREEVLSEILKRVQDDKKIVKRVKGLMIIC